MILQSQIESIVPAEEFVTIDVPATTAKLLEELRAVSSACSAVSTRHQYHRAEVLRHVGIEGEMRKRLEELQEEWAAIVKRLSESLVSKNGDHD